MVSQTQDVFDHTHPLEVDIGSGKGRFLLARAAAFPLVNFIGIERQRRRADKVSAKAQRAGLDNLRLLSFRTDVLYLLPGSLAETAASLPTTDQR